MGWKVWGDPFTNASDMSDTTYYQTIQPGSDMVLRAVRTWIIFYNNPVITSFHMKLYSNEVVSTVNTPRKLIATSDSRTKAQIITLENGVKEVWFEFQDVPLNGQTLYNLVLNGTGYVPTPTSEVAWMKAFPDPIYDTGYTPAMETLPYAPYQLYMIGATL